ncbi:MAG: hypothetical protein ACE5KZ_03050 [Candidatus Scalinduaceae bacterium]
MEERRLMLRLPLSFPCGIGRLNKKINRWEFSDELVCEIDGSGLLLETQKDLAMKNVIFRSGKYYLNSTRHSPKDRRRLFDRRILLSVKVADIN